MTGPIRILYVTTHLAVGGAELALLDLVRRLDRRRYDVTVCSLMSGGALAQHFREIDIPVYELGVDRGLAELRGAALLPLALRLRPHIVHARLIAASLWARLTRFAGARVICEEVGLSRARPQAVTWLNRATLPLCDLTIAMSRAVADEVRRRDRLPSARLRIVYFGVDVDRFLPVQRVTPTWDLITVARLERYKGVLDLPATMARIVARRPGTTLAIVGEGSARAAVERAIEERGLSAAITLLGERRDIPELMGKARVFVLPSHEEGMGVVILEAMASALPVVATDSGGPREAVDDGRTGSLVPPGDPDALADAVLAYLGDPSMARAHGAAGRARAVERFDIRRTVRDYEGIYDSLQTRSGGRAA